jgi:hypothetical protein
MVRVSVKIDGLAVFHFGDNTAGIRAVVGTGPMDTLDGHGFPPVFWVMMIVSVTKSKFVAYFFPIGL